MSAADEMGDGTGPIMRFPEGTLAVLPERAVAGADEPKYTASVEKNSRGYTWKVSVGTEGVDWDTAFSGLEIAVADMETRYGGPGEK